MKPESINWGMIGTGDVTEKKSGPAFNKIENSRLVAVGNRTSEKARDYTSRHGIDRWYEDPFNVITDDEVNVVYIATPPGSHVEYALKVIEAGKPVYIEKPMARTYEECTIINEAAAKKGVPVYVAYYRRSLEYFAKVKEILDSGSLGRILTLHMTHHFPARDVDYNKTALPWRVIPEISGGGYFHDMGCHALDILFWMLGDPINVQGSAANLGGLYDAEDTITAEITLPGLQNNADPILLTGNWSFIVPEQHERDRICITAEKGSLSFSIFSFESIILEKGKHKKTMTTSQPENIQFPFIQSIVDELTTGKKVCPSTGETAAVTSRVMEEIVG